MCLENSIAMSVAVESMVDWRDVHGKLMGIAAKRAALDADEARWLRVAEELRLWRHFGMVSAMDYMDRVLGYAPRTANERLRVARALAELPAIEAALGRGGVMFSAVKEVTRVATAETETEWLDAVAGKSSRIVEDMVSGKVRGDRPDDEGPRRVHPEPRPEDGLGGGAPAGGTSTGLAGDVVAGAAAEAGGGILRCTTLEPF